MLAERSVRRLSIRAPDAALARRGAFLIEDALRTASLPGDGGGLLLLRRLRLPPFSPAASAQQVALRLEAQCRAARVVDGVMADDAVLAGAPAVRFADALAAHMALTRLILGGYSGRAWCWPLVVKGYRPGLSLGPALRALALSLAALPEAPAAVPRWSAHLVAQAAGVVTAWLAALDAEDVERLQQACGGALGRDAGVRPAQWQAALDASARRFGREDGRHRWLAGVAVLCGAELVSYGDPLQFDAARGHSPPDIEQPPPRPDDAGRADFAGALDPPHAAAATAPPVRDPASEVGPQRAPVGVAASESSTDAAPAQATPTDPAAAPATLERAQAVARSNVAPAASADGEAMADARAGQIDRDAEVATAAGGLLFLVPLLAQLGLPAALAGGSARVDLPQRIFATLLRRLSIADDDPAWQLCEGRQLPDAGAGLDAVRWLAACRRHLRLQLGIGLYSLVCRAATMRVTATHVDVRLPIDAVDMRIRRAGLDLDPGWVAWLGRVLRFHYGQDRS